MSQSSLVTTTNNHCAFSNTFTTLRARGLSQHPTNTSTLVISIDNDCIIVVGGSIVDSLPNPTPTTLGVMYGIPPTSSVSLSLSLGYGSEATGTWSIATGNNVLVSTEASLLCNVAVGTVSDHWQLQNSSTNCSQTLLPAPLVFLTPLC